MIFVVIGSFRKLNIFEGYEGLILFLVFRIGEYLDLSVVCSVIGGNGDGFFGFFVRVYSVLANGFVGCG